MDQLTLGQIQEWEAYNELDPIGKWRDEFSLAKVECLISNIVSTLYHKEGTEQIIRNPSEFMVKWGQEIEEPEPQQQSLADMRKAILAIADAAKKRKTVAVRVAPPPRKKQSDKFQGR